MSVYEQFLYQLKQEKLHLTKPRKLVFQAISKEHGVTISKLVAELTPTVHRASIYRAVDVLEQRGIIRRVYTGWKYRLELSEAYDHNHHHHLHCTHCNKIINTEHDIALERMINQHASQYGFKMKSHELDIVGICRECFDKQSGLLV